MTSSVMQLGELQSGTLLGLPNMECTRKHWEGALRNCLLRPTLQQDIFGPLCQYKTFKQFSPPHKYSLEILGEVGMLLASFLTVFFLFSSAVLQCTWEQVNGDM